jgi:hypothetical protein
MAWLSTLLKNCAPSSIDRTIAFFFFNRYMTLEVDQQILHGQKFIVFNSIEILYQQCYNNKYQNELQMTQVREGKDNL